MRFHDAWHDGYVRVNRAFADAVVAKLDDNPEATVFFHDYHLYLAPAFVRAARPSAPPGALRAHPLADRLVGAARQMRRAVHEGLLANDVVAFHTSGGRRTSSAAATTWSAGPAAARSRTIRISVDVGEFEQLRESAAVLAPPKRTLRARRRS